MSTTRRAAVTKLRSSPRLLQRAGAQPVGPGGDVGGAVTQDILLADKQGDVTRLTLNRPGRGKCAVGRAGGGARGGGAGVPPRSGTRLLSIEWRGHAFLHRFRPGRPG
ncbi:hypothetical protein ACU4GD_26730 [Cupriavidus basilensis]